MPIDPQSRRLFLQRALGAATLLGVPGLLAACGDDDAGDTSPTSTSDGTGPTTTTPATATTLAPLGLTHMEAFTIGLNYMAEMSAVAAGLATANGLELELLFSRGAPQALQALVAGQATSVSNSPLAVVRAVSQEGAPFVMTSMKIQDTLYRLVSTPEKPFDDVEALEGRKVGFPTLGGQAEDVFNILVGDAGLNRDSMERIAVGNDAAALALVDQGQVDVIFATIEAASTMQVNGLSPHVVTFTGANPLLGTGAVTTRKNLEAHRTEMVRWIRTLRQAIEQITEPATLATLIPQVEARFGDDVPLLSEPEKVQQIVAFISEMYFTAGEENVLRNVPERWEQGVAGLERLGIAKAGSDPTSFYTNDLWEEATG